MALMVPAGASGADVAVGVMGIAVGVPPVLVVLEPQADTTSATASSATHFIRCLLIDTFLSDCPEAVHSSGVGLRTPYSTSLPGKDRNHQDFLDYFWTCLDLVEKDCHLLWLLL